MRIQVIAFAAAVSLLSGCAAERKLSTVVPPYASLPNGRDPVNPEQFSALGKRYLAKGLIPTMEELHGRRLNILEISGGGPRGAFGAGVLVGWGEAGTRPKFDVVTGISAGALLSTFAFLGEPEDDAIIADLFTGMKKSDVSSKPGGILRFAFGDNSFMDNTPLIKRLEQLITEKNDCESGRGSAQGPPAFCGSVQSRLSPVVGHRSYRASALGRTARAGNLPQSPASGAIAAPGVFPGRGSLFADGGTRELLLAVGLQDAEGSPSVSTPGDGTFYVIFNDREKAEPHAVSPSVRGIVESLAANMLSANMEWMLLRAYALSQAHRYQFKLMKIPDNVSTTEDFDFDPEVMKPLFDKGRELGRNPSSWVVAPSSGQGASPWIIKLLSELRRESDRYVN